MAGSNSGTSCLSERIQDYDVLNLLGKGGFATVYKARCRRTGIEVAIKMIDKKLMSASGMGERVRQEVNIHSRLKHPSVLELYTFFEDSNYVYLVLELAHNGELQRYLKNNNCTLSEDEASDVMHQVVQGLKYLHSHYILHRDMTLSNLLLTKDMRVKIADFGLATQLSRPDETHQTMCGTPNYISPEVAMRSAHGLEVDVWGLGCMLYTLLTGKPPFDTKAIKSTLTKVVMADYELPSYLSPEARDLIDRLLKKKPLERIRLSEISDHPFMQRTSSRNAVQRLKNKGEVESGLGTMTTGSRPEIVSGLHQSNHSHHSAHSVQAKLITSRGCDNYSLSSLRSKFSQGMSLREDAHLQSPDLLPNKHHPQIYSNDEPELSIHSCRREVSVPQVSHSCCSKRSNCDHNHHVEHSNRPGISFDRCSRSSKSSSHGKNSCCDNEGNVDLVLTNLKCRTCQVDFTENGYSQCFECRETQNGIIQRTVNNSSWHCPDRYCKTQSKCNCEEQDMVGRDKYPLYNRTPNNCCSGFTEVTQVSCNQLPLRDMKAEEKCLSWCRKADTNPEPVEDVVELPAINGNEKRNFDNVKLKVEPLYTDRLQPTRHKTKNAVLSILETGEVCIEIIKRKGSRKEERVIDVCRISSDGLRIVLYEPNPGRGVPVSDTPPAIPAQGADSIHSYDTLPSKHHKKYIYAARFVKLVQAKTPKVTFYSEQAKCLLMENSPDNDFEALFYTGGKITKSADGIKMIDDLGKSTVISEDNSEDLPTATHTMFQHFKQCYQHCLALEAALNPLSARETCFPVIVGRKPPMYLLKGKENIIGSKSPVAPTFHTFDVSSTTFGSKQNISASRTTNVDVKKTVVKAKTIHVPRIGLATQTPNGEVSVTYPDGSQLKFDSNTGAIVYHNGTKVLRYTASESHMLPDIIRDRLGQMPMVLRYFVTTDQPSKFSSKSIR